MILHNISTRYPNCLSPPVADAFSQITRFAQLQCFSKQPTCVFLLVHYIPSLKQQEVTWKQSKPFLSSSGMSKRHPVSSPTLRSISANCLAASPTRGKQGYIRAAMEWTKAMRSCDHVAWDSQLVVMATCCRARVPPTPWMKASSTVVMEVAGTVKHSLFHLKENWGATTTENTGTTTHHF